jgi:hypothetical protein
MTPYIIACVGAHKLLIIGKSDGELREDKEVDSKRPEETA